MIRSITQSVKSHIIHSIPQSLQTALSQLSSWLGKQWSETSCGMIFLLLVKLPLSWNSIFRFSDWGSCSGSLVFGLFVSVCAVYFMVPTFVLCFSIVLLLWRHDHIPLYINERWDSDLHLQSNPNWSLCFPTSSHVYHSKNILNKEKEIKKVLKGLGMEFCLFTCGFVWMLGGHEHREILMFRGESHFLVDFSHFSLV